jgi:hypothetical protein
MPTTDQGRTAGPDQGRVGRYRAVRGLVASPLSVVLACPDRVGVKRPLR